LVVLAVGVVVPGLRAAHLVAMQKHGYTLRQEERGDEVAHLLLSQRVHFRVVGLALGAMVPGQVVAVAVPVAFAVGLVVFLVVGDEVAEREAVVGGDEVDARVGRAAIVLVQVAAAC